MINYYDDPEYWDERGVDYDLLACLEYNPQPDFTALNIEKVMAVYEGEHDEEDWIWIIQLRDEAGYVFLQGGCDYTGWDCQSDAISLVADTPIAALEAGMVMVNQEWTIHGMPTIYMDRYTVLMLQLKTGDKAKTWREIMDKKFGLTGE